MIFMRKLFIVIFIPFLFSIAPVQACKYDGITNKHRDTQNIIGFTPSKKHCTNGLSLGWLLMSANGIQPDSVRINGLYINISPIQVLYSGMIIAMAPFSIFNTKSKIESMDDISKSDSISPTKRLNGVSLSLLEDATDFKLNGLQITGFMHAMGELNGFAVAFIYNSYSEFSGIMASGVYNQADNGNGLQIGLVNRTKEMTGMQIGLWNIIGNKGYPIVHFRFKKK